MVRQPLRPTRTVAARSMAVGLPQLSSPRATADKGKGTGRAAALRSARLRRRLPGLFAAVITFTALAFVLRSALSAPAPAVTGLRGGYEARGGAGPTEVVVVVPAFPATARNASRYGPDSLRALLRSLAAARYPRGVGLRVVLAPERDREAFGERRAIAEAAVWPHGPSAIRNATSGGLFELSVAAWRPPQGSRKRAILVDASRAFSVSAGWFAFVAGARRRFSLAEVAAFAPEPVSVRRRTGMTGRLAGWNPPSLGEGAEDDVFLYQGAPYAPILAPTDAESWRMFQRWFYSRRAEWFLWPGVVHPKHRLDPEWGGFTSRGRAHWTLWYTRFLAEHRLFVLYPRGRSPAPPRGSEAPGEILALRYDGQQVGAQTDSDGAGATSAEVDEIARMASRHGGMVSITLVNQAFLSTARSWICNVDVAGFRPPAVVWIATDEKAYEGLKNVPGTHAVHMRSFKGGTAKTGTHFNTPGYWLLMLERTRLIRDLLDRGVGVFAFETDQIWLRDPVPAVRRLVEAGDGVDLVGTLDTRHQIGGNFLYFAPTLATQRLWREVARRFAAAYYGAGMHKHTARFEKYIENDQSIMTNLVFYDAAFKTANPVVFRALDTDRFVDGRWYLANEFYGASAQSPSMINNNFLVGIGLKVKRAKEFGHWFWDKEGGKCDSERVREAIRKNEEKADAAAEAAAVATGSRALPGEDYDVGVDSAIGGIARALK